MSAETIESAAADAVAAPLDLLLTDAAPGKARYQVAKDCPEDPAGSLRRAETCHRSWWPDHAAWLAERCGEEKAAPAELGGGGLAPICDAPGTYGYDR